VHENNIRCAASFLWIDARALADIARDAVHNAAPASPTTMSIEVRDDDGSIMQVNSGSRLSCEVDLKAGAPIMEPLLQ
jgi:multisubunit Na+/H+ antiporter MnhE subunit